MTAKKKRKLRNSEYYGNQENLDALYSLSRQRRIFTDLIPLIISEENILLAYRNLKKNFGSTTPGTDGRTIEYFKGKTNDYVIKYVRSRIAYYIPQSIRRVEIPKANGKKRPLGIPTIGDRLVQQCILQILEPIAEAKFYRHSYGFRPGRSAHNAIAAYYKMIQQMNLHFVVEIDIKSFFDNINHSKLLKQLWSLGIRDKKLIKIISLMLQAEVAHIGFPEKGTPQGGIISPLLANIVLNELDWWVAKQWEYFDTKYPYSHNKDQEEYSMPATKRKALKRASTLKEGYIIRYADDFKIICKSYKDAQKWYYATIDWLNSRLHLEVNAEKSKICNLRTGWSQFLGLKIKVTRKGNNRRTKTIKPKYVVESHITDNNLTRIRHTAMNRMKDIIKEKDSNNLASAIGKYNAFVMGMQNYYQVATHITEDVNNADYLAFRTLKKKTGKSLKRYNPTTDYITLYIKDRYGKSSRLKILKKFPIIPISYVQHVSPKLVRADFTIYTKEGREKIHKTLPSLVAKNAAFLSMWPIRERSIEYNDNRISLYVAQQGKCAITKKFLDLNDIRCHHKIPTSKGGTDAYDNLIIVSDAIHKLIHAVKQEIIEKYLKETGLSRAELAKLNALRALAGNFEISC